MSPDADVQVIDQTESDSSTILLLQQSVEVSAFLMSDGSIINYYCDDRDLVTLT